MTSVASRVVGFGEVVGTRGRAFSWARYLVFGVAILVVF